MCLNAGKSTFSFAKTRKGNSNGARHAVQGKTLVNTLEEN